MVFDLSVNRAAILPFSHKGRDTRRASKAGRPLSKALAPLWYRRHIYKRDAKIAETKP